MILGEAQGQLYLYFTSFVSDFFQHLKCWKNFCWHFFCYVWRPQPTTVYWH